MKGSGRSYPARSSVVTARKPVAVEWNCRAPPTGRCRAGNDLEIAFLARFLHKDEGGRLMSGGQAVVGKPLHRSRLQASL